MRPYVSSCLLRSALISLNNRRRKTILSGQDREYLCTTSESDPRHRPIVTAGDRERRDQCRLTPAGQTVPLACQSRAELECSRCSIVQGSQHRLHLFVDGCFHPFLESFEPEGVPGYFQVTHGALCHASKNLAAGIPQPYCILCTCAPVQPAFQSQAETVACIDAKNPLHSENAISPGLNCFKRCDDRCLPCRELTLRGLLA